MPLAEGKTFDFEDHSSIRSGFLETIEYSGNPQVITCETGEFSAVCPFSGLPDIAKVTLEYIPADKIIELKSLKYYYTSFRNVGIYQEAATDRIFKDLEKALEPRFLKVTTLYNIRGGILTTCVMDTRSVRENSAKNI
ncbi:MAG: preQ(1) synthase [Spirochaetia bacterium]|jgi:7-cyano-7-deazaguanine reductase|nr:preQ(1) synthase [Spirochaetia bacterium]